MFIPLSVFQLVMSGLCCPDLILTMTWTALATLLSTAMGNRLTCFLIMMYTISLCFQSWLLCCTTIYFLWTVKARPSHRSVTTLLHGTQSCMLMYSTSLSIYDTASCWFDPHCIRALLVDFHVLASAKNMAINMESAAKSFSNLLQHRLGK